MTPDNLDSLSLEELNRIMAVEIAGWFSHATESKKCHDPEGLSCYWDDVPPFSTSADAILPWLEKGFVTAYRGDGISETIAPDSPWTVHFRLAHLPPGNSHIGTAPTFPHAAAKALIRAERAKKQA
jgi:hypothetical protein